MRAVRTGWWPGEAYWQHAAGDHESTGPTVRILSLLVDGSAPCRAQPNGCLSFHPLPRTVGVHLQGPSGPLICAQDENPEEFWKNLKNTPIVAKHPDLSKKTWHRTVPLGLHGDASPVTKHDSLLVITWNSLFGTCKTMDKRFIFTVIRESDMGPQTMKKVWELLAWSLNRCLDGLAPTADFQGSPFPGGTKPTTNAGYAKQGTQIQTSTGRRGARMQGGELRGGLTSCTWRSSGPRTWRSRRCWTESRAS